MKPTNIRPTSPAKQYSPFQEINVIYGIFQFHHKMGYTRKIYLATDGVLKTECVNETKKAAFDVLEPSNIGFSSNQA